MSRVGILAAAALAVLSLAASKSAHATIVHGQVDDFEGGTLAGWAAGGAANPNGPINVASGGPGGAGDNYLRLTANGSFGAGGKLVVFNSQQWSGNYLDAGVSAIQLQVNNLGTTDLALWLILQSFGPSISTRVPVNVMAGSGWHTVSFSLAASNLANPANVSAVLANVVELNLVHSATPTFSRSGATPVVAVLGIDNVAAVPEPSTITLALLGLALVAQRVATRRPGHNRRSKESRG